MLYFENIEYLIKDKISHRNKNHKRMKYEDYHLQDENPEFDLADIIDQSHLEDDFEIREKKVTEIRENTKPPDTRQKELPAIGNQIVVTQMYDMPVLTLENKRQSLIQQIYQTDEKNRIFERTHMNTKTQSHRTTL